MNSLRFVWGRLILGAWAILRGRFAPLAGSLYPGTPGAGSASGLNVSPLNEFEGVLR